MLAEAPIICETIIDFSVNYKQFLCNWELSFF